MKVQIAFIRMLVMFNSIIFAQSEKKVTRGLSVYGQDVASDFVHTLFTLSPQTGTFL